MYLSLIDRLKNQHKTISEIISGVDENRLLVRPRPGKWHIKDNIAHLARYQEIFRERIDRILRKDVPRIERYRAEDDPGFEHWKPLDLKEILHRINSDRKEIFDLVTSLTEEEAGRTGIHKKYGKLTVVQWTEFFLLHEAHHIYTVFQLANDTELPNL